jgi:hypothetical protein
MPSLGERFADWVWRKAVEPIAFHPSSAANFGPGIGNQPDHQTLLREAIGVADTAIRAIGARVSTLDPLVKISRRVEDGTLVDEILDDHRLKLLLDRPHPNITRAQLLRLTTQHILITGEAYWLKVGSLLGVPMELHPIPPQNITPLLAGGIVVEYEARTGDGRPITLSPDSVVRFYLPDPENAHGAEGILAPEGIIADSIKFAGQHLRKHFQMDATPKAWLEAGPNAKAFSPEAETAFYEKWKARYNQRLGSEAGLPGITPTGYGVKEMRTQSGEQLVPLLEFWMRRQLMGFQTPRAVLGEVVSGDRSSAETMDYVFDRHAVSPFAALIADALTLQLAPDFDAALFVEFAPFIAEDKDHELKRERQDLELKVKSIQQVLKVRNENPDDAPWGNGPIFKIGDVLYDDMGLEMTGDEPPGALEDDEPPKPAKPPKGDGKSAKFDEDEALTASNVLNGAQVASLVDIVEKVNADLIPAESAAQIISVAFGLEAEVVEKILSGRIAPESLGGRDDAANEAQAEAAEAQAQAGNLGLARAQYFTAEREWERLIQRERKHMPPFARAMRLIFKKQRDNVLAKLDKIEPRKRDAFAEQRPRQRTDEPLQVYWARVLAYWERVTAEEIFDPENPEWRRLFKTKVDPVRQKTFLDALGEVLEGLDVDEFVFSETMQQRLKARSAQLIEKANKTTQNRIARALAKAAEEGEGLDAAARRILEDKYIRKQFAIRRKQAVTIARTEVGMAATDAHLEGYALAEIEEKRWNTSRDAAVRETHGGPDGGSVDGQKQPLGTPFTLEDEEKADGPRVGVGGAPLSAHNSINCRCFLTPVVGG